MKTLYLPHLTESTPPCAATIGFFDGIHRGHQHLIATLKEKAQSSRLPTMVITFARHPRQVLQSDWQPQLLSTASEKESLLEQLDIDYLVVLQFDQKMAALSAREFMNQILCRQLHVQLLVIGYDNHFGNRSPISPTNGKSSNEGFDNYVEYGRELGIKVLEGHPLSIGNIRVSSSVVRRLLAEGDVKTATECLGRPYSLSGKVVQGEHVGTGIGFPTANLYPEDSYKQIPAAGSYAVTAQVAGRQEWLHAMTNIGTRPTFGGQQQTLETHIFGFSGNLYGQLLTLQFHYRLRAEQRFDSIEALKAQLRLDAAQAEELLTQNAYL
jgi:riboflavin kinase/FMN adenylyltransferase